MSIAATANLHDVTQRFEESAQRAVLAARELSESAPGGGGMVDAMVSMSVNAQVAQGALAAVRTSHDLTYSILDIVA